MADANTKVSIFFETFGKKTNTGWTETFYMNSASPLDQISFNVRRGYIPARVNLLGIGARAKYLRISNIPPNRSSFVEYLTGGKGEGTYYIHDVIDDFDPTQNDLLLRMQTAQVNGAKRRSFWLAGLPDEVTDTGQETGVKPTFISDGNWGKFVKAIFDMQFLIRYVESKGPPKVYKADPIAFIVPVETRKRNRGRPFNQFRGKKLV